MYDIIIVGAGPAGMTAAIYGRRASKKVLVLEATSYGGQIINTIDIENYPVEAHITGFDFATKLYNQVLDFGSEVIFEKVIEIKNYDDYKEVITNKNTYKTKTIILATGSSNRKLGLDNEDKFIGKGVSYCATCDGAFYKNRDVAVIGGGNTALEDALYLSDIARNVYLIHRRDEFRGDNTSLDKLRERSNVRFLLNKNISRLNGDDRLDSIDVIDNDNNMENISVSGLFIAIGRIPNLGDLIKDIDTDKAGYIIASENCKTNIPGIFVAGDGRTKEVRQLVTATSDGAIAANGAINYINNN